MTNHSRRRRRRRTGSAVLAFRLFFPMEINRVSYCFRMVLCLLVGLLSVGIFSSINTLPPEVSGYGPLFSLMALPFLVAYAYVVAFIVAPRLRDAGLPRLAALLALVPGLN